MAAKTLNILIPIFNNFNTLDVGGPLDVLCNFALRGENGTNPAPFNITIAGETDCIKGYEGLTVRPDCLFKDVIGRIDGGEFDVLLVPGIAVQSATDVAIKETKAIEVIQAFMACTPKSGVKWIVSICVGALLLGKAGAFEGLDVTTHWGALEALQDNYAKDAPPKSVTQKRWIDAGFMKAHSDSTVQTRVVTSGGISCGLDCSLWFLSQILGLEAALATAATMDYDWNVNWKSISGFHTITSADAYRPMTKEETK